MRHLIVKALHRDESFLSLGVDRLITSLEENKGEVELRDLYAENFQPVLTTNDFQALKENNLPEDIRNEQEYISQADYIWFIFPVWWTSMPAILKGYIDRVFLSGFAYTMSGDRPVGLLRNKKVIIINSMGMSYEEYEQSGTFKALELTIDKGIFEFTGMEVIKHKYFTSIMSATPELRARYLQELTHLAASMEKSSIKHFSKDKKKKVA